MFVKSWTCCFRDFFSVAGVLLFFPVSQLSKKVVVTTTTPLYYTSLHIELLTSKKIRKCYYSKHEFLVTFRIPSNNPILMPWIWPVFTSFSDAEQNDDEM